MWLKYSHNVENMKYNSTVQKKIWNWNMSAADSVAKFHNNIQIMDIFVENYRKSRIEMWTYMLHNSTDCGIFSGLITLDIS